MSVTDTAERGTWNAIVIHPDDDVAVAVFDLQAGDVASFRSAASTRTVTLLDAIPIGHKLALHAMEPGAHIHKYGETIGAATAPIAAGAHVHVHNLASLRARRT